MLEVGKTYTHAEMANILGTTNNEGIKRKLQGYGVEFGYKGWGNARTFTINSIPDPFKLFAIIDLGLYATTDFTKAAYFYFRFFNDVEFSAMPYKVKAEILKEENKEEHTPDASRNTISKYETALYTKGLVSLGNECLYQIINRVQRKPIDKETYCKAWNEFFRKIEYGTPKEQAFASMCAKYGGIPRKCPIPILTAWADVSFDTLYDLVCDVVEKELSG